MHYELTALVTLLSLALNWAFIMLVGKARGKYGIAAPAITGNPDFERVLRVQYNTLEILIMHLPALWLFAIYVSDCYAAGIGLLWIVGRILYARGYYIAAGKRSTGFLISFGATTVLIVGALIGVAMQLAKAG